MTHPDVLEAAVVAIKDDKWGERPQAFVTVKAGKEVAGEEVLQWAKRNPQIEWFHGATRSGGGGGAAKDINGQAAQKRTEGVGQRCGSECELIAGSRWSSVAFDEMLPQNVHKYIYTPSV